MAASLTDHIFEVLCYRVASTKAARSDLQTSSTRSFAAQATLRALQQVRLSSFIDCWSSAVKFHCDCDSSVTMKTTNVIEMGIQYYINKSEYDTRIRIFKSEVSVVLSAM